MFVSISIGINLSMVRWRWLKESPDRLSRTRPSPREPSYMYSMVHGQYHSKLSPLLFSITQWLILFMSNLALFAWIYVEIKSLSAHEKRFHGLGKRSGTWHLSFYVFFSLKFFLSAFSFSIFSHIERISKILSWIPKDSTLTTNPYEHLFAQSVLLRFWWFNLSRLIDLDDLIYQD